MCNNVRREDQLVSVAFPDTDPNLLPEQARYSTETMSYQISC